jgi:hypothetical protein
MSLCGKRGVWLSPPARLILIDQLRIDPVLRRMCGFETVKFQQSGRFRALPG